MECCWQRIACGVTQPYLAEFIQTFPRDWVWDHRETKTNTEHLMGNAVPLELECFVAEGVDPVLLR